MAALFFHLQIDFFAVYLIVTDLQISDPLAMLFEKKTDNNRI